MMQGIVADHTHRDKMAILLGHGTYIVSRLAQFNITYIIGRYIICSKWPKCSSL